MLKGMSDRRLFRTGMALLALCAALPALADTQFRISRMTRNDVPPGKGQCDIRLQVDNEVDVSVHGDMVMIHTLAGRDPRDDGSECNGPLPDRNIEGFNFQVMDSRNEIRLVAEPSRRNNFTAVVHIRDSAGGEGRYHFRLSWVMGGRGGPRSGEREWQPRIVVGPRVGACRGRRGSPGNYPSALGTARSPLPSSRAAAQKI